MADKSETQTKKAAPLSPGVAVSATVAIYFLAQITGINLLYLITDLMGWSQARFTRWLDTNVAAQFFAYAVTAFIGLLAIRLVLKWSRLGWQQIGLKRPKPVDVFYGLVGYGYYLPLYVVSSIIVAMLFPTLDFQQQQQLGFSTQVAGLELVMVFASLVILPPVYEEILCRGLLYTGLRSRYNIWIAGAVTSGLFALAHLQWGSGAPLLWAAAIDTFVLSVVLISLREKTGSLWPSISLHAIKNLVAFSLLFVFKVV